MAVHHKYDFITGKALWLNIKANSIMQDRLKESITHDSKFNPTLAKGLPLSLAATLMTHLVHIDWCDESWRQCINDLEEKIRVVLQKAKTASVGQQPDLHAAAVRALTSRTDTAAFGAPEKPTSPSSACFKPYEATGKPLTSYLHSALGKSSPKAHATPLLPLAPKTAAAAMTETDDNLAKRLKSLKVLETFSVEDLQHLHYLGEQLENFRLVMLLNSQTLRDISEHYQDLTTRDNFPPEQKAECERNVTSFARRVERIRKNLEIRVTQIESLRAWLQEGKTLLEGILQYRSVQVSHIFTESSHSQSAKMERIAYKTEQETISMHIITCVTLAFLPGTFVAAFFQSGLIDVNQAATDVQEAVSFHPGAFKLFAAICFPLMFLTFILWVVLFKFLASRARKRVMEDNVQIV
ncbi:hypothetical protein NW765_001525 [Fusarium oxysporum]|nr:hypothetical protein NW765_001525 [Fusarium oxysporum]KAJ4283673.1 hypothetical protein NW764_001231 [Fusarium oxysporum]